MIQRAHDLGLEVLLEAHTEPEFLAAVQTDADLIGINNRDLRTLNVDLSITTRILKKHPSGERIVISESGILHPADIRMLSASGANAYLIGTSIMKSPNLTKRIKEFVKAL
jgi:indole-3-glycerol phosphate synthase